MDSLSQAVSKFIIFGGDHDLSSATYAIPSNSSLTIRFPPRTIPSRSISGVRVTRLTKRELGLNGWVHVAGKMNSQPG